MRGGQQRNLSTRHQVHPLALTTQNEQDKKKKGNNVLVEKEQKGQSQVEG